MLGADYPGYFSVGETEQLARMLWRAEADAEFLARLRECIRALQPRFTPEQELASWDHLLRTLGA